MIHAFKSIKILARFKKSQYANDNLKIQNFNSLDFHNLKNCFFFFSSSSDLKVTTHPPYTNTRQLDWEKLSIVVQESNYPQLGQSHPVLTDNSRHYFPHKDQTKVEPSGCSAVKPACVSYLQRGAAIWEGRSGPRSRISFGSSRTERE